jgi:hypothetical protein
MTAARELVALGRAWYERNGLAEARALLEAGRLTAHHTGDLRGEADAWTEIGRLRSLDADPRSAELAFREACDRFAALGDRDASVRCSARAAFMIYDAGELDRALSSFDAIEKSLEAGTELKAKMSGLLAGYRANVARSTGAWDDADAGYARAIRELRAAGDEGYSCVFEMDRAALALLDGRPALALERLAIARSGVEEGPRAALVLVDHYALLAASALGDEALVRRARSRFDAPAARATEFLDRTHALALGATPAELDRLEHDCPAYEHARLSVQILRRTLGAPPRIGRRIAFSERDRTIELDDGPEIALSHRDALYRIAAALLAGTRANADDLARIGWPGEKISARSARNRVHVALATLRKLGLGAAIVRTQDGYAIAPSISIVRVP